MSRYRFSRKSFIFVVVTLAAMLAISSAAYAITYQNIYTDYQKTFSHFSPAGKHSDTESYKYDSSLGLLGNLERRHANCNDCHDPHSATRAPSPLGSYFGAGTQANVSGVKPLYWSHTGTKIFSVISSTKFTVPVGGTTAAGLAVGSNILIDPDGSPHPSQPVTISNIRTNAIIIDFVTYDEITISTAMKAVHGAGCNILKVTVPAGQAPPYAFVSSVVKEYELCFKCHSSYAFDFAGYKTTYGSDLTFDWTTRTYAPIIDGKVAVDSSHINVPETDIAMEFNPNNAGYHPVLAHGKTTGNQILPWADGRTFNETFMPGYSADSRIKCTDCHASDSTSVKGPHGSNQKYILKRRAPTEEPVITRTGYWMGAIYYGSNPATGDLYPKTKPYSMTWYVRTEDVVCYDCHDMKYYGPGKGHPSRAKHWLNCQWHRPIAMDEVGCASCKITPIHGAPTGRYMMLTLAQGWTTPNDTTKYRPSVTNWCFNCHDNIPGQKGSYDGGHASCPRFYSTDADGVEQEETRVHFQSAAIKAGSDYFVPLPTPDMPNLKGLGNLPEYRYYNRDDDYIMFKYGTPAITKDNLYKIRFDQPSTGDRPDGEPVAEVGYEDSIQLKTVDHAKDTQAYVSVDGDVIATKTLRTAKSVVDSLGNDITSVINTRTSNKDDRGGWFQGVVGYGNTIDEIYAAGNSFVMDFGDLSAAKTIKLVWGVNEEKGGKVPVLVQTKDKNGKWVTRGSARHSEDRYGYIDLKSFFPKGTKDYKIKVIPTLNSIDFMAISIKDEPIKITTLSLKRADYRKAGATETEDVTATLITNDKNYVTFDYMDNCDLFFDIPERDKTLTKRDFIFCPTGYYETGGDVPDGAILPPMTAEKAQDFGILTPAGGYANHYNVGMIDPGDWNERWADKLIKIPEE